MAQPAVVEQPQDHPDLIPSGQVCEMVPPINPFKLMGKTADASSSGKTKGRGKGKNKGTGAEKKLKKPIEDAPILEVTTLPPTEQESLLPPPKVHDLEESDQVEELRPRKKRGRIEPSAIPAEGPSSHSEAWDPALLFGPNPISIQDTILDDSNTDVSAQVAHGLTFAACLPGDMKQCAGTQPGLVFCHITRGLVMVTDFLTSLYTSFVTRTSFLLKYFFIFPYSSHIYCYFLLRLLKVSFLWRQEFSD